MSLHGDDHGVDRDVLNDSVDTPGVMKDVGDGLREEDVGGSAGSSQVALDKRSDFEL